MSENWKPGDVAIVRDDDGCERIAVRGERNPRMQHDWHYDERGIGHILSQQRRLVVIDPEDSRSIAIEIAQRVCSALHVMPGRDISAGIEAAQAVLREFANPTPPKPEEPTGLGAVVEDEKGRKWVRVEPDGGQAKWLLSQAPDAADPRYVWSAVPAVRVLSEGVTP